MSRSFGLVDDKLDEADFFLSRMEEANFYEIRHYFSAFVSAARSVTFAVQGSISDIDGFKEWYAGWQATLAADRMAGFFLDARNDVIHLGENPIRGGSSYRAEDGGSVQLFWFRDAVPFDLDPAPEKRKSYPREDVITACRAFLVTLVSLVYDAYVHFAPEVDAHVHYTQSHFQAIGKTIEDAEEELFGYRGWTEAPGLTVNDRWRLIRRNLTGCTVAHLFEKHLRRRLPWHALGDASDI
jgi:hypothetical protein